MAGKNKLLRAPMRLTPGLSCGTRLHQVRRRRRVRGLVGVLAIAVSACGGSQAVRDAEAGRYPELRAEVDAKVRAYAMSNREAADIAKAVASREVKVAQKTEAT